MYVFINYLSTIICVIAVLPSYCLFLLYLLYTSKEVYFFRINVGIVMFKYFRVSKVIAIFKQIVIPRGQTKRTRSNSCLCGFFV